MALLIVSLMTFFTVQMVLSVAGFVKKRRSLRRTRIGGLLVHAQGSMMGGRQVRELRVPMGYHETFSACHDAIGLLRRARIVRMSRDEGELVGRVGITARAGGARIEIHVIPFDERATYVRLVCRDLFGALSYDMGQCFEMIETIVAALALRSPKRIPDLDQVAPTWEGAPGQRLMLSSEAARSSIG